MDIMHSIVLYCSRAYSRSILGADYAEGNIGIWGRGGGGIDRGRKCEREGAREGWKEKRTEG